MKYLRILLIGCLAFFSIIQAQPEVKPMDEASLGSPRAAIITHLYALESGNANYEVVAKPFLQHGRTLEEVVKLAVGLKDILQHYRIKLSFDDLPNDFNYIDPVAKLHTYQLTHTLPTVYLVKVHNPWVYSQATVDYIKAFSQIGCLLSKKLSSGWLVKCLYYKTWFGIYVWQVLILLGWLLAALVLYKLLQLLLSKIFKYVVSKLGYEEINADYKSINAITHAINIFIIGLLLRVGLPFLKLPLLVENKLLIYSKGFLFFVATLIGYHMVDAAILYIIHKQTIEKKLNFNLGLLPMVKVGLKVLIVLIGGIFALQSLECNVKGLLAGVGIGGLGFALASQDTIKNFFGSLVILTDKPFNIGDHIAVDNIEGKVEEIGFRSTRIRTNEESIIYVPNGRLADTHINNHGEKQYKKFGTYVMVPATTPTILIETFIEGIRKILERCPAARAGKYMAYLYDMKESIFYIKFEVTFDVTDLITELANRQEILLNIAKLAQSLEVDFAFPTYALHIESLAPKKEPVVNSETDLKERLQDFFHTTSTL